MKRLLLTGLLAVGAAAADKSPEYTDEEKASIEEQYQRAIKSYQSDRKAAEAIRTLAQFFSTDGKVIGAIKARYQQGDYRQFKKLSSYSAELSNYGAKIGAGSVYGYRKDTALQTQILWMNYTGLASRAEKSDIDRAVISRGQFDKFYQGCKKELNAPKPKREDFRPLAVL